MKRLFIAAMALMTVVACSKDDNDPILDSTKKSVSITIENLSVPTKAVTDSAAADGNLACANTNDLVFGFCDGAGNLISALNVKNAVYNQETGTYTFHALDQRISRVYVIANGAGNSKITTTNAPATYDAAHALWEVLTPDVEWNEVVVFGHSSVTHAKGTDGKPAYCTVGNTEYPLYTAEVTIAPAHTRLEVTNIKCKDLGATTYNKITLNSLTFAGNLVQALGEGNQGVQLDATNNALTPGTGKAWSWNIHQTVAPDLVLSVTADEGKNWNIPDELKDRTVTVVDYIAPANYDPTNTMVSGNQTIIKDFKNGEIYQLDLTFSEEDILSGSDALCVDVKVNIANWVVVKVDPIFQ